MLVRNKSEFHEVKEVTKMKKKYFVDDNRVILWNQVVTEISI